MRELVPWKQQLVRFTREIIGTSGVLLEVSRDNESNIGNFVVDAMVRSWAGKTLNGGEIR